MEWNLLHRNSMGNNFCIVFCVAIIVLCLAFAIVKIQKTWGFIAHLNTSSKTDEKRRFSYLENTKNIPSKGFDNLPSQFQRGYFSLPCVPFGSSQYFQLEPDTLFSQTY